MVVDDICAAEGTTPRQPWSQGIRRPHGPPPESLRLLSSSISKQLHQTSSMPKKRFTSQYSKPQSTVHPSLSSSSAANSASSSSSRNYLPHLAPRHAQLLSDFQTLADRDATPSVNDLIQSLRRTQVKPHERPTSTVTTPTLPPQIRQLLSQPETPAPRPRARDRRRFDINGRRIPPGPAPPRSWLEGPNNTPIKARSRTDERV
jgi:hypothetical protein